MIQKKCSLLVDAAVVEIVDCVIGGSDGEVGGDASEEVIGSVGSVIESTTMEGIEKKIIY